MRCLNAQAYQPPFRQTRQHVWWWSYSANGAASFAVAWHPKLSQQRECDCRGTGHSQVTKVTKQGAGAHSRETLRESFREPHKNPWKPHKSPREPHKSPHEPHKSPRQGRFHFPCPLRGVLGATCRRPDPALHQPYPGQKGQLRPMKSEPHDG